MRTNALGTGVMVLPSLLMLASISAVAAPAADRHAADQHVKTAQQRSTVGESAPAKSEPPAKAMDSMASGAVEDTMKACLSRIPTDGTVGQRMLAEQGCRSQHDTRASHQAAPQF